jgi:hypothetical protein
MISFLQFRFAFPLCLILAISSFAMGAENPNQTADITREQHQIVTTATSNDFNNVIEVYGFMISYYRNPQTNKLVGALETTLKSDFCEKASPADELQFACFFALAGKSEPNVVMGYKNLFEPANNKQRLFVLKVLELCWNKDVEEYFRRELKAGRFIRQKAQIEDMLEAGIPLSFDKLSEHVGPIGCVYMLWSKFVVTGRTEVIDELIHKLVLRDPNMSADDVNDAKEASADMLKNMCEQNPDVMRFCKERLKDSQGDIKYRLEEIIDPIDGSISAKRIIEHPPQLLTVTGPRGWAIGCSGVLIERNHDRMDTLATCKITETSVNSLRGLLDEWWGIKTKKELIDILSWLETEGHRKSFERVAETVVDLNDEQFNAIVAAGGDDKQKIQKLLVARKFSGQLGKKSILGWDFTRYVALCRWGYTMGLLSEQEAWEKIMPVARKLQSTFDSWEDLGCNYLIGRQFWSYKETAADSSLYEDAVQRLLDMPSSPWNKYPWNMNLDSDKDVNDVNEPNSRKTAEAAK